MRRALLAALALALFAHARDAAADCTDAGACGSNEYCATTADGGVPVTDGGAGVCVAEPCVLSSDCPNDELCDTSQDPFRCVECISTADCPGDLLCDITTRTCVPPPEAGPPDGGETTGDASAAADAGAQDAAADATTPPPADGAAPPPSPFDGGDGSVAPLEGGAQRVDTGTLDGGACDCGLTGPAGGSAGGAGASLLVACTLLGRRSRRRRSTSAPCARSSAR